MVRFGSMFTEFGVFVCDYMLMFSILFSGDIGYDRVRPVSYTGADLVIACFSIGNPESLHNIVTKVSSHMYNASY